MKEMAHCLVCGEPMGLKHLIGKRKTCSPKCKQQAYRNRKNADKSDEVNEEVK